MTDWQHRAAALAEELTSGGKLSSPEWRAAVCAVPRHTLVPRFVEQCPDGRWTEVHTADGPGLERVYSNTGLYIKLGEGGPGTMPTPLSSTSTPSLMTRMLEMLDIRDGHRVLEIGTGTGYNAALLAHRLGDHNVFSVDIDHELVDLARQRLKAIGYQPTLAAADGAGGLPENAPYDRIVATCSVPAIPWPWVDQLSDGGLILTDLKRGISAGNLVLLQRDGACAQGRFDAGWAAFMALRSIDEQPVAPPARDRSSAPPRASKIGYLRPWDTPVLWFLAALRMPVNVTYGHTLDPHGRPRDLFLYTPDGSWAELSHDTATVREGGPHHLWLAVEDAHELWIHLGQPSWDRFGLTASPDRQWVWLDEPDNVIAELDCPSPPHLPKNR